MVDAYETRKQISVQSSENTGQPVSNRLSYFGKSFNGLHNLLKSITRWFSRNHQWLSSLMVVIGLPATVISLGLTREQMNTAQNNFKEEMSVQRKATAAVLFNEFLKGVINLEANQSESSVDQKEALKKLIAKQADFIIQGTGDSTLRSNVLSFISENYSDMFIPVMTDRGMDTLVNLSGQEYTGEISANFANSNIANASFPKTRFQNTSFDKAHILYSHFPSAVFYNPTRMANATLQCVSFNGATLFEPDVAGAVMEHIDFRGVKTGFSIGKSDRATQVHTIATLLLSTKKLNNVLVDDDVYTELEGKKTGIIKYKNYPHANNFSLFRQTTSEQWISNTEQNKLCG